MRTDYKFWYIKRGKGTPVIGGGELPDGPIEEVAVRFYEGDIGPGGYRRTRRLQAVDVSHLGQRPVKAEASGAETILYTAADFGVTRDEDEVCAFLDAELGKDPAREPVDEQKGRR